MASVSRFPLIAAAVMAFAAPSAFVACGLAPLSDPQGTGGSSQTGTTTTATTGTGGSGAGFTTGTGGSGGSSTTTGGAGGATTTGTGGTGGQATGSGGATTGTGGSTMGTGGGQTTGSGGTMTGTGGGSTSGSGGGTGGMGGAPMDGGATGGGGGGMCGAVTATFPLELSPHVAACSVVTYSTNPPTSGPHYPSWAAFKTYSDPVPRGFYVHAMEHGAVVVAYNCPAGCAADVATLQAYLDARPPDPLCAAPLTNRFILTPDPLLDVPFAAAAWGAHLKMSCVDLVALGAFIDTYYAKAPENFCFDGFDPTDPASGIPADCGEPKDAGVD